MHVLPLKIKLSVELQDVQLLAVLSQVKHVLEHS